MTRFVPPRRFAEVRFETYIPNDHHPSQGTARHVLEDFARPQTPSKRRRWFRRGDHHEQPGRASYLDGGFGVGKTHLLASLWHAADEPKAYMTFAELTAIIGFLGMGTAIETFSDLALLCVDEFELDDVANTLMSVTFLRAIIDGTKVAATSNTLPEKLGEGRFAAEDFKREIAAIADHFKVLRIDGPDYRAKDRVEETALSNGAARRWVDLLRARDRNVSVDDARSLIDHLRVVHPIQVGGLLDGLDAVAITDLQPIANQGDALLFVHLIDELYDSALSVAVSGCPLDELFPGSYRHGGYRKKYGRCESRLAALVGAAVAEPGFTR